MWLLKEQPKLVKADKALAERFRDMEPCPHDRTFQERRADLIRDLVKDKQFRTAAWAYAYCKETKKTYRINGKHTSRVLCELNGELKNINILLEKYECDTLEDVAKLYATFDARWSARTTTDINRVYAASNEHLISLPSRVLTACVTGLSYSEWEDNLCDHLPEERAQLALKHVDFCLFVNKILSEGEASRHLQRSPVIAAMMRTYTKAQAASNEFWALVRDGSSPRHTSPDRKLQAYLISTSVNHGGASARSGKGSDARRAMFVKCIHAWNAWRRSEVSDLKYYSTAKTPAAV